MRADDDDTIVRRANAVYLATFLSVRTIRPAVPSSSLIIPRTTLCPTSTRPTLRSGVLRPNVETPQTGYSTALAGHEPAGNYQFSLIISCPIRPPGSYVLLASVYAAVVRKIVAAVPAAVLVPAAPAGL
jgi:hypothetical protein